MHYIEEKVYKYINNNIHLKRGSDVILGVSGGSDSVALLLIFLALKSFLNINITLFHVEHGIRGKESIRDAEFTKDLAKKYNIDYEIVHVDALAYKKEHGMSEEEAARNLRYNAFKEKGKKLLYDNKKVYIAVAHHKEDNVETVLLQLIRGTGLRGISGMKAKRDNIIRPLLCLSKDEILNYLRDKGQDYKEDSTNKDDRFNRNKIRHKILPILTEINDKAIDHILNTAEKVSEAEEYFSNKAISFIEKNMKDKKINVKALLKEDKIIQEYIILNFLRQGITHGKDISKKQIDAAMSLIEKENGKSINLSGNLILVKANDEIYLKKKKEIDELNSASEEIKIKPLKIGEEETLNYLGYEIKLKCLNVLNIDFIHKNRYTEYLDYDVIKHNLYLRTGRKGDYFFIDKDKHTQTLKKYFVNEKVDRFKRHTIPLLASEKRVNYIIGYRICESVKITEKTETVLKITVRRIFDE